MFAERRWPDAEPLKSPRPRFNFHETPVPTIPEKYGFRNASPLPNLRDACFADRRAQKFPWGTTTRSAASNSVHIFSISLKCGRVSPTIIKCESKAGGGPLRTMTVNPVDPVWGTSNA
jgi:hypothetical protein